MLYSLSWHSKDIKLLISFLSLNYLSSWIKKKSFWWVVEVLETYRIFCYKNIGKCNWNSFFFTHSWINKTTKATLFQIWLDSPIFFVIVRSLVFFSLLRYINRILTIYKKLLLIFFKFPEFQTIYCNQIKVNHSAIHC